MSSFSVTDDLIASHGQRVVNYLMDAIFQVICMLCILFGLVIVSMLMDTNSLFYWLQHMGMLHQYLFGALIAILYFGMSETFMEGRTLGKLISGTVVVMEDGSTPDSDVILKRTFCRLIPLEFLTFLGMPCRGWHDSIPGVFVVDKKLFDASLKKHRASQKRATLTNHQES